ncbi:GNAT family N-acetyltransferase [Pseudonocardia sp. NPDC046786]|uniref:GNAT family N-acetyltransferase n=1 Tax=Pseudonocardia sp. NPDC046786 TaxID=3155471 RepID=UPI003408783F
MAVPQAVPPVLTDGVVTLRGFVESDVAEIAAVYRDPEIRRRTTLGAHLCTADARAWTELVAANWATGDGFGWAVEAAGPDGRPRYAGQIDLRPGPPPSVGFLLAPWARGAGRMSRALRLAAGWGFTGAGFEVLHWACRAGHVASWRVAHACGFAFDGVRTRALPGPGGLVDAWTAVLLPDPAVPSASREPRTTWWPVPVLGCGRIRLRPPSGSDVDRHLTTYNDPESRWWDGTRSHEADAADAHRWLLHDTELARSLGAAVTWVIADRDDDRYLGTITVSGMDRPYAPAGGEIGYRAHPDTRGRGHVAAALRRVTRHAFTPVADGGLGRNRLALGTAAENGASRRVAERAGFRQAAAFRADGVCGLDGGIVSDGVWYELLAADR